MRRSPTFRPGGRRRQVAVRRSTANATRYRFRRENYFAHPRCWAYALSVARKKNKPIAVWHLHFRQRLRVQNIILPNDPIQIEDVGRDRVELIVGQGLRLLERHCATDVVEERGCIGPVASDRLNGHLVRPERANPADECIVRSPSTFLPVTRLALREVDLGASYGCAPPRWKADSVGADADISW